MEDTLNLALTGIGTLLLLSIFASKAATRFGVPSLLIFLALGMLSGSDGPGGIPFDQPDQAQVLGVVALIFIMFSGGLESHWGSARPVLWQGISLATVGVLVSTMVMAAFAFWIVDLPLVPSILLGAMISSTDAAALFSVLKAQQINLKGRLNYLLELESGTNDPMAVFLTMGLISVIRNPETHWIHLVNDLFLEMGVGAVFGYGFGKLSASLLQRMKLPSGGLYPVLTVSLMMLSYGATSVLGGSGFLAVYVTGIVVGNSPIPHRRELIAVHDGFAWLMQITMFLVLGLLVFPSQLHDVASIGLICALYLCLVARPVSVFVALAFTRVTFKEKVLISWMGLRGAVPIILATFPMIADVPQAQSFFNLVFYIVLASVLLQGTTIPWLARKLDLLSDEPAPDPSVESQETRVIPRIPKIARS